MFVLHSGYVDEFVDVFLCRCLSCTVVMWMSLWTYFWLMFVLHSGYVDEFVDLFLVDVCPAQWLCG